MFLEPTNAPIRDNPYVGPRSFRLDDANFFGRERETRELVNLLTAERVVLMHSPSGAGKTSLIQAALIPKLAATFNVLPIVRVGLEVPAVPGVPAFNRYLASALLSLKNRMLDLHEFASPGALLALLDRLERPSAKPEEVKPQLLIFDQFEELLTLDPHGRVGKRAFFKEIGEVLRRSLQGPRGDRMQRPPRWALFAMRSEYVADMQALYFRSLPNSLGATYRLDVLNGEQARDAIREPARNKGVTFCGAEAYQDDSASEKLVRDLSASRGDAPEKEAGIDGLPLREIFVEPVQLQVVCFRLWERLWLDKILKEGPGGNKTITVENVGSRADVNNALSDYYSDKVVEASKVGVNERDIRVWCEQRLITPLGELIMVQEGQHPKTDLDPRAVQALIAAFLVRRDKKGVQSWLELSHKRLIEPIRGNNKKWFENNLLSWQQQALQWARNDRGNQYLLRGAALADAQSWAGSNARRLDGTDRDFLEASLNAATTQDRLKSYVYRWWAYLGSGMCVLLLGLAVSLYFQNASEKRLTAEARRREEYVRGLLFSTNIAKLKADLATKTLQQVQATRNKQRPIQPGLGIGSLPSKDLPLLGACILELSGSPSGNGPLLAATAVFPGGSPTKRRGAGVITAFVQERAPFDLKLQRQPSKKIYILTITAALGEEPLEKGAVIYQPSWLDEQPGQQNNMIAKVSNWITVRANAPNNAAGMIAELLPEIAVPSRWDPKPYGYIELQGTSEPQLGQAVRTVSRSSILGQGRVRSVGGQVRIKGLNGHAEVEFEDVIVIEDVIVNTGAGRADHFAQSGDGGAPVFTDDDKLVGIIVGWSNNLTYALRIAPVLDALNVDLILSPPPRPPTMKN